MIRNCPKCGAYHADELLTFCLDDGTPLIDVDPSSEKWSEATRVIEQKQSASTKQLRKLKWRRLVLSSMTAVMLIMIVTNSFSVETTPAGTIPELTFVESPSPTPTPTPILTKALFFKISGRVVDAGRPLSGVKIILAGSANIETTTDSNGSYSFLSLFEGGNYIVTAQKANMTFMPPSQSFDNLQRDQLANFSTVVKEDPKPPQDCSKADSSRERKAIENSLTAGWARKIRSERAKVLAENVRDRIPAEASLSAIEPLIEFTRGCQEVRVTLRHEWRITTGIPAAPGEPFTVPKKKVFSCSKTPVEWSCTY